MIRRLGDIWKQGGFWKLQLWYGIFTYSDKQYAIDMAEALIGRYRIVGR